MTRKTVHKKKQPMRHQQARSRAAVPQLSPSQGAERIAKHIARAGICSRRKAEELIAEGRVKVNGELLSSPAVTVSASDVIEVDGKRLPQAEPARLWRYYKPRGLIVSHADEKGRKTVFDALPDHLPRVISVGRLDYDSEGLLLLTNDGGLARHLEMPSTGWIRKYRVRVRGQVDTEKLASVEDGVTIDGIRYGEIKARLDTQMTSNAWLTVAIKEGKNREIRNVMDYLGYPVSRLIRLSYGPFQLGNMEEEDLVEVKDAVLAEQLGADPASHHSENDDKPRLGLKRRPRTSSPRAQKGGRPQDKQHRAGKSVQPKPAHAATSSSRKAARPSSGPSRLKAPSRSKTPLRKK